MDNASLGLTGFGFWLAIAVIVIAIIWAVVQKQRMKHELTLKLLEKGQDVDQELLAKLLAADKSGFPVQQKSVIEQHRDAGGFIGLMFLVAGLIFAFVGIMDTDPGLITLGGTEGQTELRRVFEDSGPSWGLIGLGAFTFAFGWLCWIGSMKEYDRAKAEEKQAQEKLPRD